MSRSREGVKTVEAVLATEETTPMNDAAAAVRSTGGVPRVTPAPAKRTCSEETRQKLREKGKARWDAKRAAKASAIPGKTKGMTMAVQN